MKRVMDLVLAFGALLIAIIVLFPIISVFVLAVDLNEPAMQSVFTAAFKRYLTNTILLVVSVAAVTAIVGVSVGWLVVMYNFPGRRLLEYLLFLPLALPAYVGAYALVDFLEYAGPVQTHLRSVFGWNLATDYYFPEIRSIGGAIIVLSASLYPYVYLLTRISLKEQSATAMEIASTLGAGPLARMIRIGLPLIRPGIVAGLTLVMMETIADYGVVDYFAVQTLTTRIYTVWFQAYDINAAAQVSTVILLLVLIFLCLERLLRKGSQYYLKQQSRTVLIHKQLFGLNKYIATLICTIPFIIGFLLPLCVLLGHSLNAPDEWFDSGLFRALTNSLITSGFAALLTVLASLLLVYWVRSSAGKFSSSILPLTTLGYAAPGAVIGLGILYPLTMFDHAIADTSQYLFGFDPGLLLTGSAAAIVLAYTIRFFAIAQGATDAALGRVSPSILFVARTLGQSASGTLLRVHLPIIRGSVLTASLLVFVDCVKELPATLLLRPFNYNTLATRVYEHASLEDISSAAPAALLVTLIGGLGVIILARTH